MWPRRGPKLIIYIIYNTCSPQEACLGHPPTTHLPRHGNSCGRVTLMYGDPCMSPYRPLPQRAPPVHSGHPPLTSFAALAIVNSLCPRSARYLDNWAVKKCQATKGADSAQTSSDAFLSVLSVWVAVNGRPCDSLLLSGYIYEHLDTKVTWM